MHHSLDVSPEAELDLQNAFDYYFAINIDLADRLKMICMIAIKKKLLIHCFISTWQKEREKIQTHTIEIIPYIVIYRINDNTIIVASVFNTYRKPVYGKL